MGIGLGESIGNVSQCVCPLHCDHTSDNKLLWNTEKCISNGKPSPTTASSWWCIAHFQSGFQFKWRLFIWDYFTSKNANIAASAGVASPLPFPLWQRGFMIGAFSETITLPLHLASTKTHFSLFSCSHFLNVLLLLVIALGFCFHFLLPKPQTSMWRMHGGIEQQVLRLWHTSHPFWRLFSQYLFWELKIHLSFSRYLFFLQVHWRYLANILASVSNRS